MRNEQTKNQNLSNLLHRTKNLHGIKWTWLPLRCAILNNSAVVTIVKAIQILFIYCHFNLFISCLQIIVYFFFFSLILFSTSRTFTRSLLLNRSCNVAVRSPASSNSWRRFIGEIFIFNVITLNVFIITFNLFIILLFFSISRQNRHICSIRLIIFRRTSQIYFFPITTRCSRTSSFWRFMLWCFRCGN
uniref:Uncharacterized protein n=1 Tax=Meloidogyne incognita TaxID=6306 RepID=A0A914M5B6_MELIC